MKLKVYMHGPIELKGLKSTNFIDSRNMTFFFEDSTSTEEFFKEIKKISVSGSILINRFELDKNYVSVILQGPQNFPITITP